jgi:hypothetical protein
MKKLLFTPIVILGLTIGHSLIYAQSTWTQKANYGTATYRAVGFSIGTKGYIGTGLYYRDFWEWDQATNLWTQKADFGGTGKDWATGFSIGNKGYLGVGNNDFEFWEWDQASNTWTQKPNYPGGGSATHPSYGLVGAIGFSIGNKGYIGTGNNFGTDHTDFWEYNQALSTWIQKTNLGGAGRLGAVGFSIGTKGYIGTGQGNSTLLNDFWEWDQATDTWTQKASLPAAGRNSATGFSIGTKGYIGTGLGASGINYKDFWEWDQATNTWSQKPDFSGGKRCRAVGFSIGNYGYIGTGTDSTNSDSKDFWEFNPLCSVSPASICMVTVDSNNTNVVVWEKPIPAQRIDSFRIYREVSSTYKHIGSVPFSAISTFTDPTSGVNPTITSYKYEISVKDSCGNETPLSTFHKTIHVALSPASPCGYNLIWNDYIGFTITQYLIYRDSAKTGWKVIDSLSFGNTSWTDGTCYAASDTIAYLIEAINPAGCTPSIKNPTPMSGYISTRSNIQQNYANTSVGELTNNFIIQLFPNPFSTQTVLQTDIFFHNATLTLFNPLGKEVKHIENISGQSIALYRDNLPAGLYFFRLTEKNKIFTTGKLVITDN